MSGRCYSDTDRIAHFKASADERLPGEHGFVEVRYDEVSGDPDRRTVDEICTTQIHLERMDRDTYWMSVCGLHVWFRVEMVAIAGKRNRQPELRVTCYPSSCTPYVVKPGEGTLE